jgi:hypothetical protein
MKRVFGGAMVRARSLSSSLVRARSLSSSWVFPAGAAKLSAEEVKEAGNDDDAKAATAREGGSVSSGEANERSGGAGEEMLTLERNEVKPS